MNGKWNGDEHLPPEARKNAQRMVETLEADDDRMSAKQVTGVTFIDGRGKAIWGGIYANLLYCQPVKDGLVAVFTTHMVVMKGPHLVDPPKNCLMRKLLAHKLEFVEALAGGGDRDFGQETTKPISIEVTEVVQK